MGIGLFIIVILISAFLSTVLIAKDAKDFAVAPPSPLVDLDRMYDVIFSELDENTGNALTPKDLHLIVDSFVGVLSEKGMIKESISQFDQDIEFKLTPSQIADAIEKREKELDVERLALEIVVEKCVVYLQSISAIY